MKNKFSFIQIVLILICMCACAKNDMRTENISESELGEAFGTHNATAEPKTAEEDNTAAALPPPPEYIHVSQIELPKSGSGQVLGNRLNNCNIVYNPEDECYYVSQLEYIHVPDDEGTTVWDLSFQTKMDKELSIRTKLSDDSFESLQYVDGKMYYILNKRLMCYYNQTENMVVDMNVRSYCIDGDTVYYKSDNLEGFWAKNMNADDSPVKLPIKFSGMYQVTDGKMFFEDERNIYMYDGNKTVLIYRVEQDDFFYDVDSFLVDGVLLYLSRSGHLIIADEDRLISKSVKGYTVIGNNVYYSTDDGLFVYDLLQNTTKTLISIDYHANKHEFIDGFFMIIKSIAVYNDKLFLKVGNSCFGMSNILVYCDLDGGNLRPVVDITKPDFQTYFYTWQGFSISYPIGYVLNSDSGSYHAYFLMISDPEGKIFMRARNWKIDNLDAEFPSVYEGYEKIRTNQGYTGYYKVVISDNRFDFKFELNEFSLYAEGEEHDWEIVKPILFEMMKSFEILE